MVETIEVSTMLESITSDKILVGTGTLGIITAIFYKIWDVIKSDRRQDKSDAVQDQFRDDLMTEVRELRLETKIAHEAQILSARREAELSAQVEILSSQVTALIKQVEDLQNLLEDCKKNINAKNS